jgi:hypothetical protein
MFDALYELVIGERRWRASRMAKQETIPAIIRDLTDLQAIEANLIEQLHRTDLSPMEEANGYHRPLNDHGFSVEDACYLARCVSLAEKDKQLSDAQGKALTQSYAAKAMAALLQAVRNGFQDVAHMQKETDLDALRGRGDFKKLLGELRTNTKATGK